MANKRPKYDQKYIEKLKAKGMISEDTYRLCMNEGGVVPAMTEDSPFFGRTLTNIGQAIGDAYSNLKGQTEGLRGGTAQPGVVPASDAGPQVAPMPTVPAPVDQSELALPPAAPQAQPIPAQDNLNSLNDSFGKVESAIQKQGAAAMNAAGQENQALGQLQTQVQEQEAKNQLREQERLRAVEQKEAEIQKISEELKVDPTRWDKNFWGNASTGQKVLAGIGLILGGAGSVKIFDDAVQRDIDAQKANIDKTIGTQKTLLQSMRDRFGDERTAELATKRVMLDQAELKLKQIGANYKGAEAQANMQLALGELQMKKSQVAAEMQARVYQQQALRELSGGSQSSQLSAFLPEEARKRFVPLAGGLAPTEQAANKLNELGQTVEVVRDNISALKKIGTKSYSNLNPQDRAEADTIQNALIGQLRIALTGPGPLTDSERDFIKGIIANPTNIFEITAQKRLNSLMTTLDRNFNASLRAYGIKSKPKLSLGDRVR